jgi:hypothetical protein
MLFAAELLQAGTSPPPALLLACWVFISRYGALLNLFLPSFPFLYEKKKVISQALNVQKPTVNAFHIY